MWGWGRRIDRMFSLPPGLALLTHIFKNNDVLMNPRNYCAVCMTRTSEDDNRCLHEQSPNSKRCNEQLFVLPKASA